MPGRRSRLARLIPAAVCSLLVAAGLVVATAPAASATTANPTPSAGSRRSATQLPFPVSGTGKLTVDVGSGNGLFTDQLLTLPGIGQDLPITLSYNSSVWGGSVPSSVTGGTGSGWAITGFDQRLIVNADSSITYYGPGGLSGVFPSTGSGTYSSPAQFQETLSFASGVYTLLDHSSQMKLKFNSGGRLTQMIDRNANATTFAYDGSGNPASDHLDSGTVRGTHADRDRHQWADHRVDPDLRVAFAVDQSGLLPERAPRLGDR